MVRPMVPCSHALCPSYCQQTEDDTRVLTSSESSSLPVRGHRRRLTAADATRFLFDLDSDLLLHDSGVGVDFAHLVARNTANLEEGLYTPRIEQCLCLLCRNGKSAPRVEERAWNPLAIFEGRHG